MTIEHLDLRKFTRNSDKIATVIYLQSELRERKLWITCGEIEIKSPSNSGIITLASYLDNATDAEHDSAYAFSFELFRLDFKFLASGVSYFDGIISVPRNKYSLEKFRVPTASTDLFEGSKECTDKHCRRHEPHRITNYLPASNPKLWEKVGGQSIEIMTGAIDNFNLDR